MVTACDKSFALRFTGQSISVVAMKSLVANQRRLLS